MITAMQLSEIAGLVSGQLCGDDVVVAHLCSDSRSIASGDMFVALSGESFDGNAFVETAAQAGATSALVSQATGALPSVLVEDTRLAYGLIARANRRRFTGAVVGLTGSSGKTSTKEMLASILGEAGTVYATKGNLNNEVGVPRSLLELSNEFDRAVIEMGAAKRGDIRYLCNFVEPSVAILTNAQAAHIAGFGSLDGVAATKGEIFSALPTSGTAVINADDAYCDQWRKTAGHCQQLLFSLQSEDADFYAKQIQVDDEGRCTFDLVCPLGEAKITLCLPGRHMVANALAAAAAAMVVGAELEHIVAGLESLVPVVGRLSRSELGGLTLINDSYNANPGSVAAAIDVLASMAGRRVLVLGTMAELGERSAELHAEIAERARAVGIEKLFVVGEYADAMAGRFGEGASAFNNKTELGEALIASVQKGDVVLIKGSRSAAMETVCDQLQQHNVSGSWGEDG
jgi:UDP-N-acetylmuramoyl-tripeptide--D-alanyl-D-alanine ligase